MFASKFLDRLKRLYRSPESTADTFNTPFSTYESRVPQPQNCIDALPGWVTRFPPEVGVTAGSTPLFQDHRIRWLIDRHQPMSGANVLEIGPLEGAHTSMLHAAGAHVIAVEAKKQAFLKCLVTKELLDLPRAKFLLGDCVEYLEQTDKRYDLIVACGVLYHMRDPLRFLSAVAARTDHLYLWAPFIDEDALAPETDMAKAFAAIRDAQSFNGAEVTLYRMHYKGVNLNDDFCGGIYDAPRWMRHACVFQVLDALGFETIEVAHENRETPYQPSVSIYARR